MGHIRVQGLGKAYPQYSSPRARLMTWLRPGQPHAHPLRWVLHDLSFEVQPGEAVGIVGMNGAGKSTLLKIITGTTRPSAGTLATHGQVAALLELGMGFHPEFSGRQNAIMACQLLGMNHTDITTLLPAIEHFAEIGDYFEQPLRTYSSGMQMRLAFSVATARRPDILIVDEALSVGDAYFQHKSFDRIRQFREAGTTLLIVSHDRYAIQSICDRALLLHAGRLILQGAPLAVLDYYNALLADQEHQLIRQEARADGTLQTVSGSGEVQVTSVRLVDEQGNAQDSFEVGSSVTLELQVHARQAVPRLVLGFLIKDRLGQAIYGINTHRLEQAIEQVAAGETLRYRFSFSLDLGPGSYSVSTSLSRFDSHLDGNYEWRDLALLFHVTNHRHEDFVGCTWLAAQPSIERGISVTLASGTPT
ncbi:MAG: ABC transporter ATP-binding protein [Sterolibacterium sp.]|nr:ABC transporter ATP-binding protein [Sterolibacterium sp.]MBP9800235.1 ABC transporter ATP-binding protein [Sterolibacterium sp.]